MPTVSATGSAGRSIPGCPGTGWVTGAAGAPGGAAPGQAQGGARQRTPQGRGLLGPLQASAQASRTPGAAARPQTLTLLPTHAVLSFSFPSLQRVGEPAPAERRGLSATCTPVGPQDRKVFSLWNPSAPSLQQVQVQIPGRPGLAKSDMPPVSQSWGWGAVPAKAGVFQAGSSRR